MTIIASHAPADTEAAGAALAGRLLSRGVRRAFLSLCGEMGVGKTAFTRGFASHFGITGVKSPTYTIVNEYAGRVRIFHFDMYRIEDSSDLASIGYDDYVRARGYCIAEWSENVEEDLPEDTVTVTISRLPSGDDDRQIEILGV